MNKVNLDEKLIFEKFINRTSLDIKQETIIQRALTAKITSEVINQKVTSQINSINYGIKRINPKFTEKSKNYTQIKELIFNTMTIYEDSLKKLSYFYDSKIEQLIIRKFELQTHLVGSIVRQEALYRKRKAKEQRKIRNIIKVGINKAIAKIKSPKSDDKNNTVKIRKLNDERLDIKELIKQNKDKIEKMNKEIYLTTSEIKKLNERKIEAINYAMESGEKWILASVKKPKTFEKITRFFSSKINTPKVIIKTIINPLNERINDFIENELSNIE